MEQYLAEIDATTLRDGRARAFERRQNYCGGSHPARPRHADLRDYVGDVLSSRYKVTCVKNGREALAAAQRGTFDLIVSDVMMPEMDGTELLRAVRSDERIAATPFIMLSARAGEESALEGLTKGADDYVVKPFSTDELLARVGAQINAAKLRERATRDLRASEARFRTLAASLPYIVFESDAEGARHLPKRRVRGIHRFAARAGIRLRLGCRDTPGRRVRRDATLGGRRRVGTSFFERVSLTPQRRHLPLVRGARASAERFERSRLALDRDRDRRARPAPRRKGARAPLTSL